MRFKLSSDAEYAFTCGKRKLSLNLISQKRFYDSHKKISTTVKSNETE